MKNRDIKMRVQFKDSKKNFTQWKPSQQGTEGTGQPWDDGTETGTYPQRIGEKGPGKFNTFYGKDKSKEDGLCLNPCGASRRLGGGGKVLKEGNDSRMSRHEKKKK